MAANEILDVAIVGAGIAGLVHLHYARRAGLQARVFDSAPEVGGLWRRLPAWQDLQICPADWTVAELPMVSTFQPEVLANVQAWVANFGLQDGLSLNTPVRARHDGKLWQIDAPGGRWQARHLVAATGAHNRPVVPATSRAAPEVRELHSSALREPAELAGRVVLVVGGGASALDLLDLAVAQGASRIHWAYRGLRWFTPTGKPKAVAGSVRPFGRLQLSGQSHAQQSAMLHADLHGRYQKFGLQSIVPAQPFDVLRDQLFPGRHRMLARFADLHRHPASVEAVRGDTVTLTDGTALRPDLLLWGTGYATDLSWIDGPALAQVRSVDELSRRCTGLLVSKDAPNLYFPGMGLDGVGATSWNYALIARSLMSHIRGTARLTTEDVPHKLNHFDLVEYLAPRDAASFPGDWRARLLAMAMDTPDDQPYPLPE